MLSLFSDNNVLIVCTLKIVDSHGLRCAEAHRWNLQKCFAASNTMFQGQNSCLCEVFIWYLICLYHSAVAVLLLLDASSCFCFLLLASASCFCFLLLLLATETVILPGRRKSAKIVAFWIRPSKSEMRFYAICPQWLLKSYSFSKILTDKSP